MPGAKGRDDDDEDDDDDDTDNDDDEDATYDANNDKGKNRGKMACNSLRNRHDLAYKGFDGFDTEKTGRQTDKNLS